MTSIDVHVFGDAAVCSIHILSNPISQFWKVCVCRSGRGRYNLWVEIIDSSYVPGMCEEGGRWACV